MYNWHDYFFLNPLEGADDNLTMLIFRIVNRIYTIETLVKRNNLDTLSGQYF